MGRSKESLKRKRSSRSRDSGYYPKRHATLVTHSPGTSQNYNISQSTADGSSQSFYEVITYNQVPYHSWLTYFYNQEYKKESSTVAKIDALMEFFEKYTSISFDIERGLNLDMNVCIGDSKLLQKWPSIVADINANPQYILNCINAAFFEVMMGRAIRDENGNVEQVFRILRLNRINMINCESLNPLSYVQLSSYGKLISISGSVIGIGRPNLILDSVMFACTCNRQLLSKPRNETHSIPKRCKVCGSTKLKRLLDSPYGAMKVSQTIFIRDEHTFDQIVNEDRILPNIISVRLTSGLVDKYIPGDKIRVIGIPRVTLGAIKPSITGSYPLYIESISIFKNDRCNENSTIQINPNAIQRVKSEPDVFSLLVHSLCPSVHGHEIIKASLILGLFAGTRKSEEIRDYLRILIIVNLGLGKSQLLRACANVAPDGVYIRGNSSTSLESSMINARASSTEDYRFEASPLALANYGLCCLDDLDKMPNQHQIIYNAMVRQKDYTMNSELKICLPARTSIFAMTSPIKKHYDPSKTVVDNVNANRRLLSQFDLILLMRDHPDTYLDKLMCDRVLDEQRKRSCLSQQTQSSVSKPMDESRYNVDRTLRERLIMSLESKTDILPDKIFRMYVHYARLFVKPKFSNSSRAIVERLCLLRHQRDRDFMKFDRWLQTLVTLTEARAKIDLRDETTEQDVFDAIEILENSMCIDAKDRTLSSSSNDAKKLTANKVKQFLNDLRNEAIMLKKSTFTMEELRNIAEQENITGNMFSILLSKLNEQGYLLKISSNSYKAVFQ